MQVSNDELAKEKVEDAKNAVISAISETMDLYGVTPSVGNLYAIMYFKGHMNLDEMREELGMSKPSMSTGVRKLQEIEMVKKTFQRGSRKHVYIAEKDFFHSFMAFFCKMWEREAKMNMEAIKQAQSSLTEVMDDDNISAEIRDEATSHYHLLENSKVYYRWLNKLVASIRSEEIFEFLPKESGNS